MHNSQFTNSLGIGLFLFFSFVTAARAERDPIAQFMNQIDTTRTVQAFLSSSPHHGIDCSFSTKKISNVQQLKKVLGRAHFKEISALESHLPVVGLRLEFTLSNGKTLELVFGKEYYSEEQVDGVIKGLSKKDGITFLADRSIYREIYNWVKQEEVVAHAYDYSGGNYGFNCEESQKVLKLSNESFQFCVSSREREILYRVRRCEAIKTKDYYQIDENQTCKGKEISSSIPDLCPTGWK